MSNFQVQWFFAYYPGTGVKYHWNLYQDSDSDHLEWEYCNGVVQNGVVQTDLFVARNGPRVVVNFHSMTETNDRGEVRQVMRCARLDPK